MLKLEGHVTLQLLDAETLEVLSTTEQTNVITRKMYQSWINISSSLFAQLHISTEVAPHYEDWCMVRSVITNGTIPVGVTSPQAFPAVGLTPAYVQVFRRFDAPAVTRSITTVLLSEDNSTSGTFSTNIVSAYVNLASPCVQTNTQVLDVTYRIRAVPDTSNNSYNNYNQDPLNILKGIFSISARATGDTLPIASAICPNYCYFPVSSNITPTALGSTIPTIDAVHSITQEATTSTDTSLDIYGKKKYNWSYTTSQAQGILLGNLLVGNSNRFEPSFTATNILPPNGSKIQPIFSHAASTLTSGLANPFLDSLPSSGTGIVNFGGTWSAGNFPELYKIDIVVGGAVGVATYKFSKRTHFGFAGSTYRSISSGLPGLYTLYTPGGSESLSKPHSFWTSTAAVSGPGSGPGHYGPRIERYSNTSIITYDQTGVLRYNCQSHTTEMWDSTTSPALNATNIRQVAVNPGDGSLWVACANTGIYQINAAGTVITNYTTSNGLPSNNCYALDIGRSNAVWALCNGGVTTSSTGGASWTNYNAGTVPAFNSSTITGDWSSVHYMRVDPTHIDDRMFFVRYADTTLNNSTAGVWWSRGTGVAVNYTGTMGLTTRREPVRFNVSDNSGIWANVDSSTINFMTYGSNTTIPSSSSGNMPSIIFVRDSANTTDLLLRLHAAVTSSVNRTTGNGSNISTFYNTRTLYNASGTVVSSVSTINGAITGLFQGDVNVSDPCGTVYLGSGILAGYTWLSGSFYFIGGFITNLYGDGTPVGGAHSYLVWEDYGWNGSDWVLGNTNAKTTHLGEEVMLHGITAKFTNGASGTSFIAGDYYTGSVNDGILKNNAMTASMSLNHFVVPTKHLTDFDGVIRLYPYTTGVVNWRKVSASLTVNGDNSLTNNIQYRSHSLTACSKNRVFGDFSISGTFTANANQNYNIGISIVHVTEIPGVYNNKYSTWSFQVTGNTIQIINSANSAVNTPPAIVGTISWNISRVGNTITFSTSGVARYSTVDSSYSFIVRARFTDTSVGTNAFTVNQITVNSTASGYFVGLGNSGSGTGIYNNKQLLANVNASEVFISGTALTVLNQDATNAPATGGADLCPEEGILLCNAADAGKTVTGEYIMNFQASTPTGNTF